MPRRLALGLLAAGLALPVGAASVTTAWVESRGGQDHCLVTGVEAVRLTGFSASISSDRQGVFGWRDADSIAIRCIGSHNVAVFFIYVVERNDGSALLETLRVAYQRPVKPR